MAKIILGCLLTAVAGFIGAAIGMVLALMFAGFILVVFNDKPSQGWDDLFHAGFRVAPVGSGIVAIVIAWIILLLRPSDWKHASDPRACLRCGYDLKNNRSGNCPECGNRVERTQQQYLNKYHQDHA